MPNIRKVKVIGSGVIGLSCACALADADYEVSVISQDPPQKTTSSVAAAFWEPFHVKGKNAVIWAEVSYKHFVSLLHCKAAGITLTTVHRLFGNAKERAKWEAENPWHSTMPALDYCDMPSEQILNGFSEGVTYIVPVIHMPSYLDYLERRFEERSGRNSIEYRTVSALSDELDDVDILINCTGLGSRTIRDVKDLSLQKYRGQIVIIPPVKEVDHLTFITTGEEYDDYPVYVVPRGDHDVVLGGTYLLREDDDLVPKEAISARIISQAVKFYPTLKKFDWTFKKEKVGDRPYRSTVRVERDSMSFTKPVIHNYGHGGGGVTLSWGCAQEVLSLIEPLQPASI